MVFNLPTLAHLGFWGQRSAGGGTSGRASSEIRGVGQRFVRVGRSWFHRSGKAAIRRFGLFLSPDRPPSTARVAG